jgi:hypothetical protein
LFLLSRESGAIMLPLKVVQRNSKSYGRERFSDRQLANSLCIDVHSREKLFASGR